MSFCLDLGLVGKIIWLVNKGSRGIGRTTAEERLVNLLAPTIQSLYNATLNGIDIVVQGIKSNSTLNENSTGNLYIPIVTNDSAFFVQETVEFKYKPIGKVYELHGFGSADRFHLVNASVRDNVTLLELKISPYHRTNHETFSLDTGSNAQLGGTS